MELDERVAALERRVAELERRGTGEPGDGGGRDGAAPGGGEGGRPSADPFWALEGLKSALADEEAADGGVLFTGAVRLPTGEAVEWQWSRTTDVLLESDWTDAAEVFAALGHPVRMRLLKEILAGRRTVAELAALDGLGTTGQIYHHLRQLTAAGWLRPAARGRHEVPPQRVVPLLVALAAALP
ncbi:ArsR/SmtB family transcription factor [Streptomyces avicenniae]|uniref:ArsR/SmtB family transcription factor n=1 Tax=Streptomyces avicenniae TaxID=500153 RepID=UPI00069932AF|nr:helix-turn-helix domain-containing protein [Streptomyces avicenniae]